MPRYQPEPVPEIRQDNLDEVRRYIDQELNRISESMNVKVDRSYGGMFQLTPQTILLPNTDPAVFTAYDVEIPASPDGVITDSTLGSIAVLTGGTYLVSFTTTVIDINPLDEWIFTLYVNGVATQLGGTLDPSNQTEIITVSFNILFDAARGDVFTIVIESPTSSDATVTGSEFLATRVSETFD